MKLWINVSTNRLTGADQKKFAFWTKVAYVLNQNAHNGAAKKALKMLNSRRNQTTPQVSKWCDFVPEAYREKKKWGE